MIEGTKAQQDQRFKLQELLSDVADNMSAEDVCEALMRYIGTRPDVSPEVLHICAQYLDRLSHTHGWPEDMRRAALRG